MILQRLAGWTAIVTITVVAFLSGLQLRSWTFDVTTPIRFGDIYRGCGWGLWASGSEGFLNQYEKMSIQQADSRRWLDYAPLRLAAMTLWGHWIREHYPDAASDPNRAFESWQREREFSQPILNFNTGVEVLGAVCAFLLTRHWVRRCDRAPLGKNQQADALPLGERPDPWYTLRGAGAGTAAALILWFNPAMHLSAHGWPTWDMWVVPMYLLALLLAGWNLWFLCGLTIAIGAMFKGQQLAVATVFVLWPLLQGRVGASARWVIGLAFGFAMIASPWLVTYLPPDALAVARAVQAQSGQEWQAPYGTFDIPRVWDKPALLWVIGVTLGLGLAPIIMAWLRKLTRREQLENGDRAFGIYLIGAIVVGVLLTTALVWPMRSVQNVAHFWYALPVAGAIATLVVLLARVRGAFYCAAAGCGGSLLLCMVLFNGSHAWWDCGFHYGTIHWQWMIMGTTSNLPGLLDIRYGWERSALQTAFTIPSELLWNWPAGTIDVTAKQMFSVIYGVTLVLCGLGISRAAARHDRRVLVAFVAPYVMFFCFPCQIHERYLLFAAGSAAILVGYGWGMTLLGLFMTAVTWIMTMHVMIGNGRRVDFGIYLNQTFPGWFGPDFGDKLLRFIAGTHPDIAWAVLLVAGIFMYYSLVPSPRRRDVLPLERSNPT